MRRSDYTPADTDYVVSAANFLEVSEFAIFRDAYKAWYGRDVLEKQIEKVFVEYLVENRVPFWVRNYARTCLADQNLLKKDQADEYSRTANMLLYFTTIILEYALLASYLVLR